jgi:predicted nucleotidyltransferase
MNRDQALDILRRHQVELSQRGVRRAALFGSTARDQATAESDVDILVELDPSEPFDVFSYVALTDFIRDLFPGRVDVANGGALKPHVRASAQRDAIYAF